MRKRPLRGRLQKSGKAIFDKSGLDGVVEKMKKNNTKSSSCDVI
jgi:hypothetical protein